MTKIHLLFPLLLLALVSRVGAQQLPHSYILDAKIYRSAAPGAQTALLPGLGITDVIIFKAEVGGEVRSEIKRLQSVGFRPERIVHIPVDWRDMGPFEVSCHRVVQALHLIKNVEDTPGRKLLFHCTQGEDRTGMLAGLYRMIFNNWTVHQAFDQEMCPRGYEAGAPSKPYSVVQSIRQELTPVFLGVAYLIQSGKITRDSINESVCDLGAGRVLEVQAAAKAMGPLICQ